MSTYELEWQDDVRYRFVEIEAPSVETAMIEARRSFVKKPVARWIGHGLTTIGLDRDHREVCRLRLVTE